MLNVEGSASVGYCAALVQCFAMVRSQVCQADMSHLPQTLSIVQSATKQNACNMCKHARHVTMLYDCQQP